MLCRAFQKRRVLPVHCCMKAAMSAVASPPAEVQTAVTAAGLGRITLSRERQLNALGAEHVEQLKQQLMAWADPASGVKAVLLDSNNDRSFCSGGDVKAARQAVLEQPYAECPPEGHHIHRVFQAEYSTLLLVASYPLPLVSCCQGIWMGLGFGIAGFGRYRVVSDGTIFAMPENSIGLWPDVGFAYKSAHIPGQLGLFLGLTGVRLNSPADLLYCGIATHYIPAQQLQAFKQDLVQQPDSLESLLQRYSQPAPDAPGPLQRLQPVIDKHLQQLVTAWRQDGGEERTQALLQQAMQQLQQVEYRMAVRQVAHQDSLEGVRAALVDKDRKPAWLVSEQQQGQHSREGLPGNKCAVQQLFQPLGCKLSGQHLL